MLQLGMPSRGGSGGGAQPATVNAGGAVVATGGTTQVRRLQLQGTEELDDCQEQQRTRAFYNTASQAEQVRREHRRHYTGGHRGERHPDTGLRRQRQTRNYSVD